MISEEAELQTPDGTTLFRRTLAPPSSSATGLATKNTVVFLHGYDDHSGRSLPFLEYLAENGYRVVTFDFRGHGKSGGQRGFCRRWTEYLDDLDTVLTADADSGLQPTPRCFIGQSHGALVAAHRALERPSSVSGLVLAASYLRLIMPVPRAKLAAARGLSRVAPALQMKSDIKPEMLTRDPERHREDTEDPLLARVATPRWFCACRDAQDELLHSAREIVAPTLMVHGTADPIADPVTARQFFESLGSEDKTWLEYEEIRHEPLRDLGRERVWNDIRTWLDAHK